jgi:hypothetical protein
LAIDFLLIVCKDIPTAALRQQVARISRAIGGVKTEAFGCTPVPIRHAGLDARPEQG